MSMRNIRPTARNRPHRDAGRARHKAFTGAQWSPTLNRWLPFLWDGERVHFLDPRGTRDRALAAARAHLARMFDTTMPTRRD